MNGEGVTRLIGRRMLRPAAATALAVSLALQAAPASGAMGDGDGRATAGLPGSMPSLLTIQAAKLTTTATQPGDKLGYSVAVSGDVAVVGIPEDDFFGGDSGTAYVFERNKGGADVWSQVAELNAGGDAAAGDQFGTSVAISGDTIVVGAPYNDDGAENAGSAYVFERNVGGMDQWGLVEKLLPIDAWYSGWFGHSVAISGDNAVVGAPHVNGGAYQSGVAYVFRRNEGGEDSWDQVKRLTVTDPTADAWLGFAVAASGDVVVAGAPRGQVCAIEVGAAYVFERNADAGDGGGTADDWGQVRKLAAGDAAEDDKFGQSVAISGDTAVVGAEFDDVEQPNWAGHYVTDGGSAYVFERNEGGANQWGEVAQLASDDPMMFDYMGNAVAISGDAVVVAAFCAESQDGLAYLFERNWGGADGWGLVETFAPSAGLPDIRFGLSIAVSGDTIVAGAPYDDEKGYASGAAYVFVRRGASWDQSGKTGATDPEFADHFGEAVAISGDTILIGTPGEDDGGSSSGAAYVMERNETGEDGWGQVRKLVASPPANARMGSSVAIDVDTGVVGAPGAATALIYRRNHGGADNWGHFLTLTGASGGSFGCAVAISADTIVVGASNERQGGFDGAGAAYVYERNQGGADVWGLTAVLTATIDAGTGERFGHSVAISGDTIIVGAYYDDAGAAYLFEKDHDGANGWHRDRKLTGGDPGVMDWFGHSVSISGDTVAVGAPLHGGSSGAVYVFERNWGGCQDLWGQVAKLTPGDASTGDHYFGWTASIGNDTVAAGSYAFDASGTDSGAAYVFERNVGGPDNWGQMDKVVAEDEVAYDYFAYSVAISGRQVVVGAPYDDDGASGAGSAYVFRLNAARVFVPLVLRSW